MYGGEDSEEEESLPENIVSPPGVSLAFCECVDTLKWRLYEAVVLNPELNTPEAQQNKLLQTYEDVLEHLYQFLDQVVKGSIKESTLQAFPLPLRHEILACAQQIRKMSQGGGALRYTDKIPYHDYLRIQLRIYPYLHHRGKDVDRE